MLKNKISTCMEIEYLQLIKIDHENNCVVVEQIAEEGNVRDYVMAIIEQISENTGDREYRFKAEEMTMRSRLNNLVLNVNRDDQSLSIANRLLSKENEAQERYNRITEIQKGILLIVDGTEPELVRGILETELMNMDERHRSVAGFFETWAALGPAWGMIGTLIGLVNMLKDLQDSSAIGPSMATALLTTLYG